MASDFNPNPSFEERWTNSDTGEEWIFNGHSWRRADFIHTLGDVAKDDLHFTVGEVNAGSLVGQSRFFDSTGAVIIELADMEFDHFSQMRPEAEGDTAWAYKDWQYAASGDGILMLGSKTGAVIYSLDNGNTWLDTALQNDVLWNVGLYPQGDYDASNPETYGSYSNRSYTIYGISYLEQSKEFWVFWQTRYDFDNQNHSYTLGSVGQMWSFSVEELRNPTGTQYYDGGNGVPLAKAKDGSEILTGGAFAVNTVANWSPWRIGALAPDRSERYKWPINHAKQIPDGHKGSGTYCWVSNDHYESITSSGRDGYLHFLPTAGTTKINPTSGYNLDPIWEAAGFKEVADLEGNPDIWQRARWQPKIANLIHIPDLDRIIVIGSNSMDMLAYSDDGGGVWRLSWMNPEGSVPDHTQWAQGSGQGNGHFHQMSDFGLTSNGNQIFAVKQPVLESTSELAPAQLLRSFDGITWYDTEMDFGTYPNGKNRRVTAVTCTNGAVFVTTSSWYATGGAPEKGKIWGSQDGENFELLAQVADPDTSDNGTGGKMFERSGDMIGDQGVILTTWHNDDLGAAVALYNPDKADYITDVFFRGNKILLDPEANRFEVNTQRALNEIESRAGCVNILQDSVPDFGDLKQLWYQPSTNTLHVKDSDGWVALFQ